MEALLVRDIKDTGSLDLDLELFFSLISNESVPAIIDTTPFRFLNLPIEIRIQIYKTILVREKPFELYFTPPRRYDPSNNFTSLTLVCKIINAEATKILYGQNCFQISIDAGHDSFLHRAWSRNQLSRIRKVQILLTGQHWPTDLNTKSWGLLLSDLTHVSIVVMRPEQTAFCIDPVTEDQPEWAKYFDSFAKPISRYLPRDCYLQIDYDNDKATKSTMDDIFGSGRYRNVRIVEGERFFERGPEYRRHFIRRPVLRDIWSDERVEEDNLRLDGTAD